MTKNTCFICLDENNNSIEPLNHLLFSPNCKCNSLIHVACYKKCIKYKKNKCPMCGIDTRDKKEELHYTIILQENRNAYQQDLNIIYQYYFINYCIKIISTWSIFISLIIIIYYNILYFINIIY